MRPLILVSSQLKLIHSHPFIKPHDSIAIIKLAQIVSNCVTMLQLFKYDGDLSSELVPNSSLQKLPPNI